MNLRIIENGVIFFNNFLSSGQTEEFVIISFKRKILYITIMSRLDKCLPLYIGCETNKGKFTGMINDSLFIQDGEQPIIEYNKHDLGGILFLYLRKLSDIKEEQSMELIRLGFAIGRPSGYIFSNEAFLFLLGLQVDLFGLINSGLAKDINHM